MSKLIVSEIESTGTTVQINDDLKVGTTGTNAITSGNVVSPSEDMIKFFKAYETPVTAFDAAITGGVPGNSNAIPWEDAASGFTSTTALAVTSTGNSLLTNFSADAVFLYKSSGTANCKNDYWGITIDIPKVYRGQNIVLNFDYRTENASTVETAADQWFIAVQDKTNTVKTTVTNTALVSAGAAVTVASKAGLVVGDKIWLEGGGNAQGSVSNDITQTYITSISGTANEITLSQDYTPASTAGSIAVVGYLSDTLDLLAAADSDTDKVGKNRKLAFKTADDTAQVNVWFQLRNTDSVVYSLFMDNIYISANKFLQASSQTKSENYFVSGGQVMSDGNSTGTSAGFYIGSTTTPAVNTISDLGTVLNDNTTGFKFTANQDVIVNANITTARSGNASWTNIVAGPDGSLTNADSGGTAFDDYRKGSSYVPSNEPQATSAEFKLSKGEVFRFMSTATAARYTGNNIPCMGFTVTPQVNDVIILESQDEIFTDWTSYTPTFTNMGTPTSVEFFWRRVGDQMEVRGRFVEGAGAGAIAYLHVPSGYSIDTGKLPALSATNAACAVGLWGKDNASVGGTSGFILHDGSTSSTTGVSFSLSNNTGGYALDSQYGNWMWGGSGVACTFNFKVPIAGWNANFNPLLSMPLVDFGTFENTYSARIANNGTATIVSQSSDFIASVSRTSAGVVSITYKTGFFGATPSIVAVGSRPSNDPVDLMIREGSESSTGCIVVTCYQNALYMQDHEFNIVVQRQGSDYRDPPQATAAVIKPAVAVLQDRKPYQTLGGATTGTAVAGSAWQDREINVILGESWFVTLSGSGTTGVGGNNKEFTLEAGTYEVDIQQMVYQGSYSAARLYNITDGVQIIQGVNIYSSGSGLETLVLIQGTFTLSQSTQCKIQLRTSVSNPYGLGQYNYYSNDQDALYTNALIRKLK